MNKQIWMIDQKSRPELPLYKKDDKYVAIGKRAIVVLCLAVIFILTWSL